MKKMIHSFKIRSFVPIVALSTGLGFISPTFAQEIHSYIVDLNSKQVTELGSLGGGSTYARAINDAGQVVGSSQTAAGRTHAFITGANGVGMTDLGTLGGSRSSEAYGINNVGQVVGASDTAANVGHVFITGPNGVGMTDLGLNGIAFGINAVGRIVGFFLAPPVASLHAFITGPNGVGMTDLGTVGGDRSSAYSINDVGQVAGSSYSTTNIYAFITGPNGVGMTVIDMSSTGSAAHGINASGQVVGWSGGGDAFITGPNGTGITHLGTLGGNGDSQALGVNDAGQVVGISDSFRRDDISHAFITGPNGSSMTDLNSLVNLPPGLVLTEATAINNHGQVIAHGLIGFIGVVPELESYVLMLAGLALIGFMARSKQKI
jgi:probable HAF family extracellular repeat protein